MHTFMIESSYSALIMQHCNGCYTFVDPKDRWHSGYNLCSNMTSLCSTDPVLNMAMQMLSQDDHV